MNPRSFFSKVNQEKTKLLQTTVEWHKKLTPLLEQQIIKIHLAAFLDLYQNYSEHQLGLPAGKTKKAWLTELIKVELEGVKSGNVLLATVSVEDWVAGFVTCLPVTQRHTKLSSDQIVQRWQQSQLRKSAQWQDSIRKDVYISLLAVKPLRDIQTEQKIKIGLGRQLIESVAAKFTEANALTLDTRLINTPGIAFYNTLGFSTTSQHTFGGSNPVRYTGCEKKLIRLV